VIEKYAQRIESVDVDALRRCDHNQDVFEILDILDLGEFKYAYLSLKTLLTRIRRSTQTPLKFSTPPGQTIVPENSNRSGGSISISSSTESKAEPYSQNLATRFLEATYTTIARLIGRLEWANPIAKVCLSTQYIIVLIVSLIYSTQGLMEIRLGKVQVIKAIDDGGFSMQFQGDHKSDERSERIVLSIEVYPSISFLIKRQNGKNTPRRTMKILPTATLLKYTPKYLVKFATPNSMTYWAMNIKKYPPRIITDNSPL
jgi:hypothetical protein